jgi:hypothetical protein
MASQSTYTEAMAAAVATADVDRSRPKGEWVLFDRDALGRVVALYKQSGGVEKTKAAYRQLWRTEEHRLLKSTTQDPAVWSPLLVLIRLRERLTGTADRRYDETAEGPRLRPQLPREEYDQILEDLSWTEEPGTT